jgi:NADH-quinone oxidoreductase subunit G
VEAMSNEIKVKIDGIECVAQEGEYILNIARANNIFIPAICYLTRCSPTLACRLCLVEADGKRVYSCNVKAKDAMEIITNNEEIAQERRAIMEVYDVNHPLQCGVCDKSGECELQNYTLYEKVDSQTYAIADTTRPVQNWSNVLHYDASLCIVCERCTTVCKDMIGEAALKTTKRGGEALAKELKDEMPKDAYAMWNKLQKSIIAPSNGETTDCADCGECISVCPTGAIVSRDFQYKSNAWELTKVPATCAHCSVGCQLNYEIKHTDIANSDAMIYRVTNEFHYVSLCGAGRFGYDFENRGVTKDASAFDKAVNAIKNAKTIVFDSFITNEEALILQKIKEKLGVSLVNEDAKRFQDFMNSYASVTGKNLYGGDLKSVFNSDFVVTVGSMIRNDSPNSRYAFNNVQKLNKGAGIYFHPVKDTMVETFGKNVLQVNHKPGLEDAVLYLILDLFGKDLPEQIQTYLDSFKYQTQQTVTETIKEEITETVEETVTDDEGNETVVTKKVTKTVPKKIEKEVTVTKNRLLEIIGAPESFETDFEKVLAKKENFSLIVGEDVIAHKQSAKLAQLVASVEKYTDFNVVVIPPKTNTLGVSLICDLDTQIVSPSVGYNVNADFVLSATGEGDLDMPALNQQEGTFTNINKRVVPTNAALAYGGYTLNDLANALGIEKEYTAQYTQELPQNAGYKKIAFDALPNTYTNDMSENRGYVLQAQEVASKPVNIGEIANETIEGTVAYRANPVLQFSRFTRRAHELQAQKALYCSQAFAATLELNEGDRLKCEASGVQFELPVVIDSKIDGDIVYLPDFDETFDVSSIFKNSRYSNISIVKG